MNKGELVRSYTGEDILLVPEDTYTPIIDRLIYRNDFVVTAGKQKSNKSILAMQLACAVSSGTPFLGMFKVPEPQIVWYFCTEGKDNEIKDRFVRMSHAVPVNTDNIVLMCSTQLKFNSESGITQIDKLLERYHDKLPSLIIIDSMYSGFRGTLISDEQMNDFITVVRGLMERCNDSACFITTHFTKPSKDKEGKEFRQSSNNAYGSVFLLGSADHIFTIEQCKKHKMDRIISCPPEDQRSGKVVEQFRVTFNEPDPLFLSMVSFHDEEEGRMKRLLVNHKEGLTGTEIIKITKIKKSLAYQVLGEMEIKEEVRKDGGYNGKYHLIGES